jgi:hypothetical protein
MNEYRFDLIDPTTHLYLERLVEQDEEVRAFGIAWNEGLHGWSAVPPMVRIAELNVTVLRLSRDLHEHLAYVVPVQSPWITEVVRWARDICLMVQQQNRPERGIQWVNLAPRDLSSTTYRVVKAYRTWQWNHDHALFTRDLQRVHHLALYRKDTL